MKYRRHWPLLFVVGIFSFFVKLLMLTGPIYMLQVYDRVLNAGSRETLVALSVLMLFLYLIMGAFDFVRGRIGLCFARDLRQRVFDAVLRKSAVLPDGLGQAGLRGLDNAHRLISGPMIIALLDLPAGAALTPGMPVEAFELTGERSPFAHIAKPMVDYFNRAFRES